jgi:hypothetical protein
MSLVRRPVGSAKALRSFVPEQNHRPIAQNLLKPPTS